MHKTQSIAAAQAAVAHKPDDAVLHVDLGMAYFEEGQLSEAAKAFHQALALNPKTAAAYNGLGRVAYHTGPPVAAVAGYEQAMALDPHYIAPIYGLGILYAAQLGDYEKAVDAFQRGLQHNPEDAFLIASLGSTYARMGQIEQALTLLQQATALDPANAFAESWLSILYLHDRRDDEAIAACQRELALHEAHSPHRILGLIYDAKGQIADAITELEKAIALDATDYEAQAALAKLYRIVGRHQEANEKLALAHDLAQADHAEYGQACVAAVSGDVDRAVALLEVALAKGLVQVGWVRIDPEFAFMQDDPRFQALIAG